VFCSNCGSQFPESDPRIDNCPKCGKALRSEVPSATEHRGDWEYRDLVVPLNWTESVGYREDRRSRASGAADRMRNAIEAWFERRIREHLESAGREGWEADHPTDMEYLFRMGCVKVDESQLWLRPPVVTYESATIRLKRQVRR
jgi:hypothetical protein